MSQEHPITPPPELVQQWIEATRSRDCIGAYPSDLDQQLAIQAARWGADQELEACRLWVSEVHSIYDAVELLNQRRPKPLSLKQQALEALQRAEEGWRPIPDDCDTIRRALELLDD